MFVFEAFQQTVDLNTALKVLDPCAAPGGKSTLLAAALTPGSFLLGNKAIRTRIAPLRQNLHESGVTGQDGESLRCFFSSLCC